MKGHFQRKSPWKAKARALRRPFEGKDSSKNQSLSHFEEKGKGPSMTKDLLRNRRVERKVPPTERPFEGITKGPSKI
jgi:hypothetical protein